MIKKLKSFLVKEKPKISIDIGAKNIKIVEGYFNGNIIMLEGMVEISTPSNTIHDGQIIDVDTLASKILTALEENNIKSKDIIYTISSNAILNRTIELPSVKDEDITNMLEFEIDQHMPVNLDEYVTQTKVLEKIEEEPMKSIVLVSALPKMVAEEYLSLSSKLGMNPLALDTHSNSMTKLFSEEFRIQGDLKILDNTTIAILDIGFSSTNIILMKNGMFVFNRIVDFGGKEMDTNIANSFNLSLEESEQKKLEIKGLGIEEDNLSLDLIKDIMESTLETLYDEIESIFKFYTSRNMDNVIQRIYIHGGMSNTPNISDFIQNRFEIPTHTLDRVEIVNGKKYEELDIPQYLNAIGALIRK